MVQDQEGTTMAKRVAKRAARSLARTETSMTVNTIAANTIAANTTANGRELTLADSAGTKRTKMRVGTMMRPSRSSMNSLSTKTQKRWTTEPKGNSNKILRRPSLWLRWAKIVARSQLMQMYLLLWRVMRPGSTKERSMRTCTMWLYTLLERGATSFAVNVEMRVTRWRPGKSLH